MSVRVTGKLERDFFFSHRKFGEKFYNNTIEVKRVKSKSDFIPVIVSEYVLKARMLATSMEGKHVEIQGELNTRNLSNKKVKLFLMVESIEICEDTPKKANDVNDVHIKGYLCKAPICRKTSNGASITELLVAIEQGHERHFIPCITWDQMAQRAAQYKNRDYVEVSGRIQSRNYIKILDSGEKESRRTYEVCVKEIINVSQN